MSAKLKGMYAKQMSQEEKEDIISQNSLQEVTFILKQKYPMLGNIEKAKRRELEEKIDSILILDIEKIRKIIPESDKIILNLYIEKYMLKGIKIVFRDLIGSIQLENSGQVVEKFESLFPTLKGISKIKDIEELINLIDKTEYGYVLEKYFEKGNLNENIFFIEMEWDKIYFQRLEQISKKNKALKELFGRQRDVLDILWIYRMANFYGFSQEEIKQWILPRYLLTEKQIDTLIQVQNEEEIKEILQDTKYKDILTKEKEMESSISNYLYRLYKKYFYTQSYNITSVIAYLGMRELEIRDFITILEGIRYQIGKAEIQKKTIT